MSGLQPVQLYASRIPPGDFLIPAVPRHAATINVTMASIDPSEEFDTESVEDKPKRSTLKVVILPFDAFDSDDSEEDEDWEDEDDESGDSDEDINGGPSDPKKSKKSTKKALLEALAADEDEDMADEDDEEEEDSKEAAKASKELAKVMKSDKGKAKAVNGEDGAEEDEDEDDSDESIDFEPDEVVVCTLDPNQHYQQAVNFTIGKGEKVFFQVSGTHTIHLTGNYVMPAYDPSNLLDEEEDEEYDLSPNEDELDGLDALVGGDSESDELDDLGDPRVEEVDSEAEEVPKLIKDADKKDVDKVSKKRPAPSNDSDDEPSVDLEKALAEQVQKELAAKAAKTAEVKAEPTTNGDSKKLTKAEKKRLKKLKNNEGEAAPAPAPTSTTPADSAKPMKKEGQQPNGTATSEKKVQFAKNLEQGPSSSPAAAKSAETKAPESKPATTGKVSSVQGITVDVREEGTGPAARKGSRVEMRYIGKLANGKVFDSNKAGKPFSFQLGKGEVIKGWDIGLEGIKVGGQRRLVIPAKHAYGNKEVPGIPKNSELTFDVKCLTVK